MWHIIAQKEILQARRDKRFLTLAIITWVLLIVAGIGGYERYQLTRQQQLAADSLFRHEWEEQEANPHSAAHFGTWLFKPFTFLTLYDNGLHHFTGISYRVEAHHQHEVNYSTVQDTDSQLRFGELSVALVFQLLVPLLILLLAHGSISRERENNTLRLVQVQGGNSAALLWGKIGGNYILLLVLLLPAFLFLLAGPWLFAQPALWVRSFAFAGAYGLYFFIITALTVLVSAWCRHSTGSLLIGLGAWVFSSILLPRMVTNWADQAAPLPSRHAFNRQIQEGYSKGLGNDGPVMERRKRYQQQVLQQYGVDSVTQLPLNFDGLMMQYGEDYTAQVYGQVAAQTDSLIRQQQTWLETAALGNPFLAIQQVSMGLTGTDYFHHLGFHQQARHYRDVFIRQLNLELAKNGGAYGSYDYKVGPDYFKRTMPFHWQLPAAGQAIRWHALTWISLLGWTGALLLLIPLTAKKMML